MLWCGAYVLYSTPGVGCSGEGCIFSQYYRHQPCYPGRQLDIPRGLQRPVWVGSTRPDHTATSGTFKAVVIVSVFISSHIIDSGVSSDHDVTACIKLMSSFNKAKSISCKFRPSEMLSQSHQIAHESLKGTLRADQVRTGRAVLTMLESGVEVKANASGPCVAESRRFWGLPKLITLGLAGAKAELGRGSADRDTIVFGVGNGPGSVAERLRSGVTVCVI